MATFLNSTTRSGSPAVSTRVASGGEPNQIRRLRRVQRIARLMDGRFRIPLVGVSFGLDSLIGVIPGLGDAATAGVSLYILREAHAAGISWKTLIKMAGNVVVDLGIGVIPVAGDLFDVFWKANLRNAKLLELDLLKQSRSAADEG